MREAITGGGSLDFTCIQDLAPGPPVPPDFDLSDALGVVVDVDEFVGIDLACLTLSNEGGTQDDDDADDGTGGDHLPGHRQTEEKHDSGVE